MTGSSPQPSGPGEDFAFLLAALRGRTVALPPGPVGPPRPLRPQGRHAVRCRHFVVPADARSRLHRLGSSDAGDVIAAFQDICMLYRAPDDGLAFDAATLRAKPIRDEGD